MGGFSYPTIFALKDVSKLSVGESMTQNISSSEFGEYNKDHVYYHIVLSTKYREKMITEGMVIILDEVIRNIARENRWNLYALKIKLEHVHILLSTSPDWFPSRIAGKEYVKSIYEGVEPKNEIMQKLKGKSSHELGKDFNWPSGGYIGTISQEKKPKYVANRDFEYIIEPSSHKVHNLFFFYQCDRNRLEELIGYDNLMNFKSELIYIIENKTYISQNYKIFKLLEFKPNMDNSTQFFVRSIQTFSPNWILKSLYNRLIENPTDEQMADWLNNWYISSQGPKFDTAQDYIGYHDDPSHDLKKRK